MNERDELALKSIHDDEAVKVVDELCEQLEDEAKRLGLRPTSLLERLKVEMAARAAL